MELLKCKACGCFSMIPMELAGEDEEQEQEQEQQEIMGEQESRFFSCQVCGDNWLTIKQTDSGGSCQITFVHQMGVSPVLKRIAHMQTHIVVNESTVHDWEYYLGEDLVDETEWRDQLDKRRRLLKSICSN